jgi:hypothetical protein
MYVFGGVHILPGFLKKRYSASTKYFESEQVRGPIVKMEPVWRIRDVYPGSRILIFIHPGSRILDPGSKNSNKRVR